MQIERERSKEEETIEYRPLVLRQLLRLLLFRGRGSHHQLLLRRRLQQLQRSVRLLIDSLEIETERQNERATLRVNRAS